MADTQLADVWAQGCNAADTSHPSSWILAVTQAPRAGDIALMCGDGGSALMCGDGGIALMGGMLALL